MTDTAPPSAPAIGDVFAARLRQLRDARGWTRKQLAQECTNVGLPSLTEASIVNLERQRESGKVRGRREVTVEEWLALSLALRVLPTSLLVPQDKPAIALTPEYVVPTDALVAWFRSYGWHPGLSPVPSYGSDDRVASRINGAIQRAAEHSELMAWIRQAMAKGAIALEVPQGRLIELARLREDIVSRGDEPPALAADVAEALRESPAVRKDFEERGMPSMLERISRGTTHG